MSSSINSSIRKKDLTNSSAGRSDSIYIKLTKAKKSLLSKSTTFGNAVAQKKPIQEEEKKMSFK